MKKIYFLGIVLIFVTAMAMFSVQSQVSPQVQGLVYNSEVCIYKNNELIQCSPNTLTDAGKEYIEYMLGQAANWGNVTWIAVANNTPEGNHAVTDTSLDNETTCCGLERALGSYSNVGTGNWSVSKVFTANVAINNVNATGLYNQSSGGTYFAYNTFSSVNLLVSDQLNISWTIWVT